MFTRTQILEMRISSRAMLRTAPSKTATYLSSWRLPARCSSNARVWESTFQAEVRRGQSKFIFESFADSVFALPDVYLIRLFVSGFIDFFA
jgi:hypothetical protein